MCVFVLVEHTLTQASQGRNNKTVAADDRPSHTVRHKLLRLICRAQWFLAYRITLYIVFCALTSLSFKQLIIERASFGLLAGPQQYCR